MTTPNSAPELYSRLKVLTADMLTAAEAEKWDELIALEAERRKLLPDSRLFSIDELGEQ